MEACELNYKFTAKIFSILTVEKRAYRKWYALLLFEAAQLFA